MDLLHAHGLHAAAAQRALSFRINASGLLCGLLVIVSVGCLTGAGLGSPIPPWQAITRAAIAAQPPAQDTGDLVDRLVSDVVISGLERVDEQLVRNNIRIAPGDPYDPHVVRDDVARLSLLGQFRFVTAAAQLQNDGTVRVIYQLTEQPLILEVQFVGNTLVTDQDLRAAVAILRGSPRDEFQIENAQRQIEHVYRTRGHFLASVSVDEAELEQTGILLFRIVEGPRLRIRAIEFVGNEAYSPKELMPEIETRTSLILFRRGELDEDRLSDDVAALNRFYRDRGYLDVRVDRQIELSPDEREAKVIFLISEGRQYRFRSVRTERRDGQPLEVFAPEQLAELIAIRPGDVYSGDRIRQSIDIIRESYGRLGRVGASVVASEPFRFDESAQVDLVLVIEEGSPATVGLIDIQGNFLTQDRVIRRHIRLQPGRPLDFTEIDRTTRRIRDTRLFNDVRMTIQPALPRDPESDALAVHDILVEVKERNTGSINFGVAYGTDTGVFGEISLSQSNFDLFDFPDSFSELFTGRAFRGAGQRFNMVFRPGNEIFEYAASVTEPHLFETDFSLTIAGSYFRRFYRRYDEERMSGNLALGRRLGDVWEVALRARAEQVRLSRIDPEAPVDVFDAAGPDMVTALGIALTRNTFSTIARPGNGSRLTLSYDRIGALGGDFSFNRINAEHVIILTVNEDFLGRKSTLRLATEVGYLFGGDRPPIYERFFRGGRSFRGFRFREVSPKGLTPGGMVADDPIGGEWMIFFGAQYEFPIFADAVTAVIFTDTGTVTDSPGFDEYRVSIGAGVRLYIPQFGPVPIAIDFAVPIMKQDGDETQPLSFTLEMPF